MMNSGLALVVATGLASVSVAQARTFESAAKTAAPTSDLGLLVSPVVQDCDKARREIDKVRCRGLAAFFKGRDVGPSAFVRVVDEAQVVSASSYDAAIKGYHLRLVGCLTCQEPVQAPGGDKRWVTLKTPVKGADTMTQAVELARPAMSFANAEEAAAWLDDVKPNLRAEFLFGTQGVDWTWKNFRGVAFPLLGSRIFNRCTGEVVFSDPPSEGRRAPIKDAGCGKSGAPVSANDGAADGEGVAAKLDPVTINQVLGTARPEFVACDKQFRSKGTAYLEFIVTGQGGSAQRVSVSGAFGGTALGQCLIDASVRVKFPKFTGKTQRFRYPVSLQGH